MSRCQYLTIFDLEQKLFLVIQKRRHDNVRFLPYILTLSLLIFPCAHYLLCQRDLSG